MQLVTLVMAAALLIPAIPTAQDRQVTGYSELPADARKAVERSVACRHFAGEISGNDSERDRQVNRQLKQLRCDALEKDADRIRRKHKTSLDVIRRIDESMAWLAIGCSD